MHAKATFFIAATLAAAVALPAQAQGKAASPFAASAATAVAQPVSAAPAAMAQSPSASAPVAPPVASTPIGTTGPSNATVASTKPAGPLLAGAPTIAQLSSLQQAALQADARKKAAELYGAPEAASSPVPTAVRRVDPFAAAAPKPTPALMKVAAILGRPGEESVEIRDAAGRVAVFAAGMVVGDWRLVEVRADAVLLRRADDVAKPATARSRKSHKALMDSTPLTKLVPLGGEFPSSTS